MENEQKTRWEDILFENRNKEYGAYVIRQLYSSNVVKAGAGAVALALLIIVSPTIAALLTPAKKEDTSHVTLTTVSLDQPPPITPDQPPPPKLDIPPPVKNVIKFLPPKVTDKPVEEEKEIPKMEELQKAEVSNVDVEGTGNVVFDEPVKEAVGETVDPNEVFLVVEQPPEYPGGKEALMRFLYENIKYPAQARRMGVEGTVFVSFIVDADGTITEARVVKGIGAGCDEEAKRVVEKLPKWIPGKQRGHAVRVRFTLPLKFTLTS